MNSFVALAFFYSRCCFLVNGCQLQILSLSQEAQVLRPVRQVFLLFLLVLCSMVLSRWRCRFLQWKKTILSFCLFSGKNSDRCRICATGSYRMLKFGNRRCFNWESCKNYVSGLGSFKDMKSHSVFLFHPSKLGTDGAWKKDRNKSLEPITGTGGLIDIVPSFKWSEITQFIATINKFITTICTWTKINQTK